MYPVFLALRYARSRAVTYLALGTVALSVASFIVVMGVLGGFVHRVEEIITQTGSPLELHCNHVDGIADADGVVADAERVPGVAGASAYVQTFALLRTRDTTGTPVAVRGVDLAREARFGSLGEFLRQGLFDDAPPPGAKASSPDAANAAALEELLAKVLPWRRGRGAAREKPRQPLPFKDFKVPETLKPAEIPREELEPWEVPGATEKPPEPGTLPVFPPDKPRTGPAGGPDDGRPLPPPPPPRKKPAPKPEELPRGAVVGSALAVKLHIRRGAEILLGIQGKDKTPRVRSFTVIGYYDTKTDWLDDLIFIDRRAAEDLLGTSTATGISVWLGDAKDMDRVAKEIRASVVPDDGYTRVRTWRDTRRLQMETLEMQNEVMMIIMLISFALTGAFILAILWVLVSDKTRDIGTLRALGAGRLGVVATFVAQGLTIGILGSAFGLVLGLALAQHVNAAVGALDTLLMKLNIPPQFGAISRGLFGMQHLPVFYNPVHILSLLGTAVGMSFLASLAPAWRAARLDPVEALRHE